jgi:hypothetical protein
VQTLDDLDQLDDEEIVEGYFDGRCDAPEPHPEGNRSRAYWHGWRVGMMDTGQLEIDSVHRRLVAAFLERERSKR